MVSFYSDRLGSSFTEGKCRGTGAIIDADFREDVAQVVEHGVLAYDQQLGNFTVRRTLSDVTQHLELTRPLLAGARLASTAHQSE